MIKLPIKESAERRAYRVNEVLAFYKIGRNLLYREIKEGRLKVMKLGSATLISREALEKWERKVQQTR